MYRTAFNNFLSCMRYFCSSLISDVTLELLTFMVGNIHLYAIVYPSIRTYGPRAVIQGSVVIQWYVAQYILLHSYVYWYRMWRPNIFIAATSVVSGASEAALKILVNGSRELAKNEWCKHNKMNQLNSKRDVYLMGYTALLWSVKADCHLLTSAHCNWVFSYSE